MNDIERIAAAALAVAELRAADVDAVCMSCGWAAPTVDMSSAELRRLPLCPRCGRTVVGIESFAAADPGLILQAAARRRRALPQTGRA